MGKRDSWWWLSYGGGRWARAAGGVKLLPVAAIGGRGSHAGFALFRSEHQDKQVTRGGCAEFLSGSTEDPGKMSRPLRVDCRTAGLDFNS